MYPEVFQKKIAEIEATREKRLSQKMPLLDASEKNKLLSDYHPDYKAPAFTTLRIGPNKGDKVPVEFANLLEAYSWLDYDKFDLSKVDYKVDVLVVGGGGAGVAAALAASEQNADVLLATKLRIGDANTMMAQGGIQAADKLPDTPAAHYLDMLGGGHYYNIPELVKTAVTTAPYIIRWLEELGMMFDKEPDGTMITIHGGGTSRKRMHSAKDYTGGEIMKILRDEFFNRNINYIEYSPAIELFTAGNKCTGAVLCNLETKEYVVVQAKTTIIATGGSGRLHIQNFPTTNHYGATGDGVVLCYRAGCKLIFMDTIQYHPTGAAYPEQIVGLLITEKCRGLGAQLVNRDGERFINELETRDAVAAAIIKECAIGNGIQTQSGFGVWLDMPIIDIVNGKGTTQKTLPAMYRQYKRFGIDITQEPILVYPTQHYQNGGVLINANCETNIENLYVAGECSGGLHGRNRLMGNSLLDVLVFGRRAGSVASAKAKQIQFDEISLEHLKKYHQTLKDLEISPTCRSPLVLPDYRRAELKTSLINLFD